MKLHENSDTFKNAIRAASDFLEIRDVFVEKDYWVTFILWRLSNTAFADRVVFKGGTSLSKVYKLIDRFSEDIDLAIVKSEDQSETEVRRLIRKIEKELAKGFNEVFVENITSKQTKFRKTAYDYSRVIDPDSESGIKNKLVLEINSFANPVPFKSMKVNSLIADFFVNSNREKSIAQYGLEAFNLNILIPESTLIEKILSLVRLSFYDDGIDKLRAKVRHFYDIYFLSKSDFCKDYIYKKEFIEQFNTMLEEDKAKFNDPKSWLDSPYT
ncbi:MAG: nucleotidyl transferase AbiEii/AbiGii toxin family protein [Bacteroidales bacterium]|nr:nucleotidyl transferase AbiEii/AbiGii toxin family protein [Bacteroidales bacterium]MCF8392081.1 nucleotidyl transferase AbiEii/AbiGii toxin family protein [Bacteroidales bacterium]